MPCRMVTVSVIGAGTWGVALATAAVTAGSTVTLFSRRGEVKPPKGVRLTKDIGEAAKGTRLVVLTVPSNVAAEVARALGDHLDGRHLVVHGVRGFSAEPGGDLVTVADVVRRETPARRIGALGGPAVTEDLIAGKPGVLVCASAYEEVNRAVDAAFGSRSLRLYTMSDLRGLEWASALVGCLAVGIGYAQALDVSPGLVAAVIARSMGEASRIASAAGGEERTLLGLAGYGDLLACIAQKERPEVKVGAALAKGESPAKAVQRAGGRVEAVELIPRIVAWAERRRVRAPIFAALGRLLEGKTTTEEVVDDLMTFER